MYDSNLPVLIAVTIVDRPSRVRTTSAAPLAASVASATAIPTLAAFKAGASLTPSPVIPTVWFKFCNSCTTLNLCFGLTEAKPLAFSANLP